MPNNFARPVGAFLNDFKVKHMNAAEFAAFAKTPEFLQSRDWLDTRWRVLERDGRVCTCCGTRGMPSNPLQVDHIKPRWKHPELALDLKNLRVLCFQCNFGKGGKLEAA